MYSTQSRRNERHFLPLSHLFAAIRTNNICSLLDVRCRSDSATLFHPMERIVLTINIGIQRDTETETATERQRDGEIEKQTGTGRVRYR